MTETETKEDHNSMAQNILRELEEITDHDEIVDYLRENLCEHIVELINHNARCGSEDGCPYIEDWNQPYCSIEISIKNKCYIEIQKSKDEEFVYKLKNKVI